MEKFVYSYKKDKIRLKAAVIFPNSYSLGMSSLGFQSVYHILSSNPSVHCERAFVEENSQDIRTIESNRRLDSFDVLFISISFEADLSNIIRLLDLSGINYSRKERKSPFVVIGGIGTSILPGYLKGIADIVVSGDAGLTLPPILEELLSGNSYDQIIQDLSGKPGIFPAPTISSQTLSYSGILDRYIQPVHSVILSDKTEFSNMGLIEVSKSCLYHCAFCLVSNAYGDYTALPKDAILSTAEKYKGLTDRLGLVAATLTNHPDFKDIIRELNRMNFKLSFSAFRVEGLDDELLEWIISNENRTLVIAPETASAKLKKVVQKRIPNETILAIVRKACRIGIKRLKLYFLVGLPGETESDLDENIALVKSIREVTLETAKDKGFIPEIIVDINPLVPKPLTPFAGIEIEDIKITKKKIIYLKNNLRDTGRTFVYGESPKNALLQYNIANHKLTMEEIIRIAK